MGDPALKFENGDPVNVNPRSCSNGAGKVTGRKPTFWKRRLLEGRLSPDERYVADRLRTGARPSSIAAEMDISERYLAKILCHLRIARSAGKLDIDVPIQRRGPHGPHIQDKICELYRKGLKPLVIAERLNRGEVHVRSVLCKHGLTRKSKRSDVEAEAL